MGAAAAVSFKRAGYRVLVWNYQPKRLAVLESTVVALESWLEQHVGPALLDGGTIEPQAELSAIDEQADLVLDCIVEDMDQKVGLFRRLPACIDRGAIFVTTTRKITNEIIKW